MNKVESFSIDHTILTEGIYLRKSSATFHTYDIRMYRPLAENELSDSELAGGFANNSRYLSPKTSHTLEHLLAFHLRDTLGLDDKIIYIGPMGCLTGFYIIVKPQLTESDLKFALLKCFNLIVNTPAIPAASPQECGNYQFNDLTGARDVARRLLTLLF